MRMNLRRAGAMSYLSFVSVVALYGCSGSAGENGAQGQPGKQGPAGQTGPRGGQGALGEAGATGPQGSQGDAGPTGPAAPVPDAATSAPSAVYILSNGATSNEIIEYARSTTTGALTPFGEFPTGGLGTGAGLGSQGALIFDATGNHFFTVNAGDNSISELGLDVDGTISLLSNVPSGGTSPISLTLSGTTLYVLNAGSAVAAANISGFTVDPAGLVPIPGSTQPLSTAQPGAEQNLVRPGRRGARGDRKGGQQHRLVRRDQRRCRGRNLHFGGDGDGAVWVRRRGQRLDRRLAGDGRHGS